MNGADSVSRTRGAVCIVQRRLTHYRVPLFIKLQRELEKRGRRLVLLHGQATEGELTKNDAGEFPGAYQFTNRYVRTGRRSLCWQPVYRLVSDAALVVVTQESTIISNYWLQLARGFGNRKLAFWGHGRNFQATSPNGVFESWKRAWLTRVDWWFAYTGLTVDHLVGAGYPPERITCLNNAIDTLAFRKHLESVTEGELARLRNAAGIPSGATLGLYCGSLYPEKRLDLVVKAADEIQRRIPSFHLTVIGDGPERAWLQSQASGRPWMHLTGALLGREKATWYKSAHVVLNPGLVGLGVLDAFAAGVALVTTASARHSPEIAYLVDGVNGRVVQSECPMVYAEAVIQLLLDDRMRANIRRQALADATRYSIGNMACRFADGIDGALEGIDRGGR